MPSNELTHKLGVLAGALMIGVGILVGVRMFSDIPTGAAQSSSSAELNTRVGDTPAQSAESGQTIADTDLATPEPLPPLVIGMTHPLPSDLLLALNAAEARSVRVNSPNDADGVDFTLSYDNPGSAKGTPVYDQIFAVVDRFDTPSSSISWSQVQSAWQGKNRRHRSLAVLPNSVPALQSILGPGDRSAVFTLDNIDAIRDALFQGDADIAIVPFEQLIPELVVYDIDEQNPLHTGDRFDPVQYPLNAVIYAHTDGFSYNARQLDVYLNALPHSNRDSELMTTVAMTGVTAMVRLTAARMDSKGNTWPAEVVGPELAAADITVISNEVPFVDGCETDVDTDNVVFCSDPGYMETLVAVGTDLVGLTGNHQNDYGAEGGRTSLQYYAENGMQVYGGGADKTSAMAPLVIDNKGNRLAFIGANSYGPPEAWATDFTPGSAPFDLNIMSAMIRNLKAQGEADVVLAELQYQESYDTVPLPDQQKDFKALVRAGADIVTGVQSHVPQAIEFLDGNLILYGLGNLFFDQMFSDETREGIIVMHTIYDGRHISTRLLPTMLHDYGQPQWASSEERARILDRVFSALPFQ